MGDGNEDDFAALMSSLSNATGTECEPLTIEMMQEAVEVLGRLTRRHADADRAGKTIAGYNWLACHIDEPADPILLAQRRARRVSMARKRRRGWA